MWWLILLVAVVAKTLGKKLGEWAKDENVKKEWGELVQAIDEAYRDGKITIDEIWNIGKEAKDVIREITKEK